MRFRTSLRYRVALAFALTGALVSLGLAAVLHVLTLRMEERVITETLTAELEDFMARYRQDPATPPPSGIAIRTYVVTPDARDVPPELVALSPGPHRLELEGLGYFAEVAQRGDTRFIVLYDDAQLRQREAQFRMFLAGGVLFMTLISAFLGFWMAGRVIHPVAELARRIGRLAPGDAPESLARDFPPDETGQLARAFETHLARLAEYIERERAFTADVSHELRTPLTVIKGATEVLLADPGLSGEQRARIERIARAAQETSELTGALLMLAREEQGGHEAAPCRVDLLLEQVLENHRHLLKHKDVDVVAELEPGIELEVECSLLRVVLSNLIRNAYAYTHQGHVRVRLDEEGVLVEDTGIGIAPDQLQQVFERHYSGPAGGEGIGLSLVRRICDRYGWQISIESHENRGTLIRLSLGGAGQGGHAAG